MKEIQIAPNREDCKIDKHKVTGTMDNRTFVFELPKGMTFAKENYERHIRDFQEAIALCSKQWQIEELLNRHYGIQGAKFYELKSNAQQEISG